MLADTFSSVAIIIGAIVIYYTNIFLVDTLLSVVVALVVGKWAVGLIWNATTQLLDKPSKKLFEEHMGI